VKLRIQGSALRLRLTQKEVAQLRDRGCVESSIEFAPKCTLVYLLEGSFHAKAVTCDFDGQAIRVVVPTQGLTEWIQSDQVSIEAQSQAGLQLLIEKDFQCLHRSGEQDPDAYPHPAIATGLDPRLFAKRKVHRRVMGAVHQPYPYSQGTSQPLSRSAARSTGPTRVSTNHLFMTLR